MAHSHAHMGSINGTQWVIKKNGRYDIGGGVHDGKRSWREGLVAGITNIHGIHTWYDVLKAQINTI